MIVAMAWIRGLTMDAKLVLGLTALITIVPLVPAIAQAVCALGIVWLTVVAWSSRSRAAAQVGIFLVACLALASTGLPYSQLTLGVGLLIYALVTRRVVWMEGIASWLRRGSFGADVRVLTAASGIVAAVALGAWYLVLQPDVDDIVRTFVPAAPLGVLIAGGLLFSMVNAAVEEGAYRGVLLHGLDTALGKGSATLILQAAAFGALHVHGFPRGAIGIGLAMIYGLLMGMIRRRADGMLAPWLAHVFTDIVIAAMIVMIAHPEIALRQP